MKKSLLILSSILMLSIISASCTYTVTNSGGGTQDITYGYINIICDKPSTATEASWKIKHGSFNTYTIEIPDDCFNLYSDRVELRMVSRMKIFPSQPTSYGQCYNGEWKNITKIANYSGSEGWSYNDKKDQSKRAYDNNWNTNTYFADNGNTWNYCIRGPCLYASIYEQEVLFDVPSDPVTTPIPTCTTDADTNNNKKIDLVEVSNYLNKWKNNIVTTNQLLEVLNYWKNGEGC